MKPLNVSLDEIVEAMEAHFDGTMHWFLDIETGAVRLVEDDDYLDEDNEQLAAETPAWQREAKEVAATVTSDPERFIEIPQIESHEAYRVMEEFIPRVANPRLRERLADAIAGKGAFRRFKDTLLSHPDVREQWFTFEASAKRTWAAEWLASLGIEPTRQPLRPPSG
jgi:hypothetical protein